LTRLPETGKKRTKRISKMRMARNLILTIHSQAYTTSNWKRRNRRKVSGKGKRPKNPTQRIPGTYLKISPYTDNVHQKISVYINLIYSSNSP